MVCFYVSSNRALVVVFVLSLPPWFHSRRFVGLADIGNRVLCSELTPGKTMTIDVLAHFFYVAS